MDEAWLAFDSYRGGAHCVYIKYTRTHKHSYTDVGKQTWGKKKQRARERAESAAAELVALYAEREATERAPCRPDDAEEVEEEVAGGFGFELTEGQRRALADVERDMVWRRRPMDRLVLGDVGFGKTEVAVRAVWRAVSNGRQAAVLAPTTILAAQHFARLQQRFPGVEMALLRGTDAAAVARETRAGLKEGRIRVRVVWWGYMDRWHPVLMCVT